MALLIKLFSFILAVIELYEQQNIVNLALQPKRSIIYFLPIKQNRFLLITGIFRHSLVRKTQL